MWVIFKVKKLHIYERPKNKRTHIWTSNKHIPRGSVEDTVFFVIDWCVAAETDPEWLGSPKHKGHGRLAHSPRHLPNLTCLGDQEIETGYLLQDPVL